MRRRRKRKREKISKAQGAADSAEPDSQAAASAAEGGDDAAGKEEEDEKLTAADELAPMQVCSQCHHLTLPRLQCCAPCLALHQHAWNWLNCCCMHNGCGCCNHGLQTRVVSYHACACTNMPEVSESWHDCMRCQLIGSLMNSLQESVHQITGAGVPCQTKLSEIRVHFSELRCSQTSLSSNASHNDSSCCGVQICTAFSSR